MTPTEAKRIIKSRGYIASRGNYYGSQHQDRACAWYLDDIGGGLRDRRGRGYRTLAEAAQAILEQEYLEREN